MIINSFNPPIKKKLILLSAILVLLNCQKKDIDISKEFEEAVFYEIFPALIDSIHYDFRLLPPPPPPPSYINDDGKEIKIDSMQAKFMHAKAIKSWENQKQKILKDTTSTYLTILDSINYFEREDLYELILINLQQIRKN